MSYCPRCGARNSVDARVCIKCNGVMSVRKTVDSHKEVRPTASTSTSESVIDDPTVPSASTLHSHSSTSATSPDVGRNVFGRFFDWLNNYVGNSGPAELNWRSLFSAVAIPHSREQAEEIFTVGTPLTTPDPKTVCDTWPKPWLYSRILLWALITYGLLYFTVSWLGGLISYPGLVVIGSFAVPIAILVLFFELNVWRNISFYRVTGMFFIGGCASIIATIILNVLRSAQTSQELTYISACCVGFTEELAKAIMVLLFMKISLRSPSRILNGMLVGAAVGAGFAAFESSGYAFSDVIKAVALLGALVEAVVKNNMQVIQAVIEEIQKIQIIGSANVSVLLRGILAPGGHVAWAAILGAAFSIIAKTEHLKMAALWDGKFWRLAMIPVVLHAVWDMPFQLPFMGKYIGLILGAWTVLLFLVNRGLSEIKQESK